MSEDFKNKMKVKESDSLSLDKENVKDSCGCNVLHLNAM